MELCVFQGTFNPIHIAHLRVANFVMEKYSYDKLLFIPAYNPPHKNEDLASPADRFNMAKLATKDCSNCEVCDIEYKRQGISYTYLTICELKKIYLLKNKINFIIGTDAFEKIETWYETDKLKNLVHFLVFNRGYNINKEKLEYLKKSGYDFSVETLEFEDISSSFIRQRLKNNESISDFVDKKVKEYIKKNGVYRY